MLLTPLDRNAVLRIVMGLAVVFGLGWMAIAFGAEPFKPPQQATRFRLPVSNLVAGDFGPAPEHPDRGEVFLCSEGCLARLGQMGVALTSHNVHLDASVRGIALTHSTAGVALDPSRFSAMSGKVEITLEGNRPELRFRGNEMHPRLTLQFQELTSAIVARDRRGSITWSFP